MLARYIRCVLDSLCDVRDCACPDARTTIRQSSGVFRSRCGMGQSSTWSTDRMGSRRPAGCVCRLFHGPYCILLDVIGAWRYDLLMAESRLGILSVPVIPPPKNAVGRTITIGATLLRTHPKPPHRASLHWAVCLKDASSLHRTSGLRSVHLRHAFCSNG